MKRPNILKHVRTGRKRRRIVAMIGPRQCGKTTPDRELVDDESLNYFDLEDTVAAMRLTGG